MYIIKKYTYNKARKLGLTVIRSKNKTKKLDVYKKGKKMIVISCKNCKSGRQEIAKNGADFTNFRSFTLQIGLLPEAIPKAFGMKIWN